MGNDEHEDLDTVLDRLEQPNDPGLGPAEPAEYASPTVVSLEPSGE